ncbi:MAG: hypothetical protein ABIY63_13265 [Fibrobacteria bacterium]
MTHPLGASPTGGSFAPGTLNPGPKFRVMIDAEGYLDLWDGHATASFDMDEAIAIRDFLNKQFRASQKQEGTP